MTDRPRVLIEDWLPIAELGVESQREGTPIPGQSPKLKTLHTWWARRPLVASAGVILTSLLPAWSEGLAEAVDDPRVATPRVYRRWILNLCGVLGDPIAAAARIERATEAGRTLGAAAYGYPAAWKNTPNPDNLALLHRLLEATWGCLPSVIDPTAGGGSIPFQALRFGLPATANDLNAVAAAVLRAGLEVPTTYGSHLVPDVERWATELRERCRLRLEAFFPVPSGTDSNTYMFVRSVDCPRTGKPTPLAPNWWLSKKGKSSVGVRVVTERSGVELKVPEFDLVGGDAQDSSGPSDGTVKGGSAISVWDGLPIDGDYIKAEAKAGRMKSLMYAITTRSSGKGRAAGKRTFRAPTAEDLAALEAAEVACAESLSSWLAAGAVPQEERYIGPADRSANYGITRHVDLFSPRQLLVHGTYVDEFQRLCPEVLNELGDEKGRAVLALLGIMQGKALTFNSVLTTWNMTHEKRRSVFDTHSFAFKWTFIEIEGARELFEWAAEQVLDSYRGITELLMPGAIPYVEASVPFLGRLSDLAHPVPGSGTVTQGSASDLKVQTGSQALVCIDPPYYDNVMYAELSDFFGVWEQHTVGKVWPDLMPGGLADTTNEAVANVARFVDFGRRRNELANADYQAKMLAIFSECHRVLRDDGVMTVMFTHKRAEAWDTLGMALMEAGFEIATSWPVNTEPQHSLHIAEKNAASSTVMLVCRKRRAASGAQVYFEDLVSEIKSAARDAVARFEADGIRGVDLLLSTYGPVLSVISSAWPVYSSEAASDGSARLLRPEEALDVAREELVEARRRSIVGRDVTFDPITDFWLIAWELFQAEEFPYDEARRLALAVGGQDPEDLSALGILKKKAGTVVLQAPADRRRRVLRPVQDGDFEQLTLVDVLHGVMVTADLDGLPAAKTLMDRHGLTTEPRFLALVQGAVNAVPRSKLKGVFIRPEAATLDALVTAYLPTIVVPEDEPPDTLFDVD